MADNIMSSSSLPNPSSCSRLICRVCQKQFSQYTCPRCNTRYCSLPCYKSHSLRCTESFMRDNVVGELHHLNSNQDTKHKMLRILQRLHSQEESDSIHQQQQHDSWSLSEETIHKILSGERVSLDDLSAEEAKRFKRAVASGELSKLIKPWEPWWMKPLASSISLTRQGTRLVQPLVNGNQVSENEDLEPDELHDIVPPGPEAPLPSVKELTSAEPSPLLPIHLVDIVYAYCFALRLYNGDRESDPIGLAMAMFSISSVLGKGGMPETVSQALAHCLEQTCSPAFRHMGGFQFAMGLVDDVVHILDLGAGALLLVCLLSDVRRLIQAARRDQYLEEEDILRRTELKTNLKAAERKVYFITCWVNEQPKEAWSSLATIVKAEKASALECQGKKPESSFVKDNVDNYGKPLIKEIN